MPRFSSGDLARLGFGQDGKRFPVEHASQAGAVPEAELHDAILAFCRKCALPVVHSRMDRPTTCQVGTPDFVIAMPEGRTLWIEAKAGKGKVRPEQLAWMAALKKQGHTARIVRTTQEFLDLIVHEKPVQSP